MHDFGHPVSFNAAVGDLDVDGNPIDRQFRYYPTADPPVLVTDGGVGTSESAMQTESIEVPGGGIAITADTQDELLTFYWQATRTLREHHDAVARGEKPPASTPDGNPPPEELPPPEQGSQSNGMPPVYTEERVREHLQGGVDPHRDLPPPGMPTVEIEIETFTEIQRQLVVSELQPIIDLQEMVIQTQCILLSQSLPPDSPHHAIMDMWMQRLEEMRLNRYGSPTADQDLDR